MVNGRGSASALSLSAITAPTQATAGSSSAECPGKARGTIEAGSTSTVPSSSRRLETGDWRLERRRYSYLPAPIAPSDGRCDGPLRLVPVHGCLHGASTARAHTRPANPQSGLTAKGCLAVQTPLPLARTRPRGPGLHWQGTCTGWPCGTSYAPATVPSTVQVQVAAQVLKSTVPLHCNQLAALSSPPRACACPL